MDCLIKQKCQEYTLYKDISTEKLQGMMFPLGELVENQLLNLFGRLGHRGGINAFISTFALNESPLQINNVNENT